MQLNFFLKYVNRNIANISIRYIWVANAIIDYTKQEQYKKRQIHKSLVFKNNILWDNLNISNFRRITCVDINSLLMVCKTETFPNKRWKHLNQFALKKFFPILLRLWTSLRNRRYILMTAFLQMLHSTWQSITYEYACFPRRCDSIWQSNLYRLKTKNESFFNYLRRKWEN